MNLQEHPAHIHVNHFQLVTIDASDAIYFQVGDWHDTIQDGSDDATVRMQTDTFTGGMIVHCHVLGHEDTGMMAVINITGNEGAVWPGASAVDSSCYADSQRGWSVVGPTVEPSSAPPSPTPTPAPDFSPSPVPVPAPSKVPLPVPTHKPFPSPSPVPVPAPSKVPLPVPTHKPFPSPSPMPVLDASAAPSPAPTRTPTLALIPRPSCAPTPLPSRTPTSNPTVVPTPEPTTAPTPAPSNDCDADEFVYRMWLDDSAGDGWNGATYEIREMNGVVLYSGTLEEGFRDSAWCCLPNACFYIGAGGGSSDSEISFKFVDEVGGYFQDLKAPFQDHFCVNAGDVFDHPTTSPTVSVPPTPAPTAAPTTSTDAPTLVPAPVPSLQPTSIPVPLPTRASTPPPVPMPMMVPVAGPTWIPAPLPTAMPMPAPAPTRTRTARPSPRPSRQTRPPETTLAAVNSAILLSGLTAARFGEDETAAFKRSLVIILSHFIDDTDDVVETTATDYSGRRALLNNASSSTILVDFTLSVDLDSSGYTTNETSGLAHDVASDLTASVESGELGSVIESEAGDDSALAEAGVAVNGSKSIIESVTQVTSVSIIVSPSFAPTPVPHTHTPTAAPVVQIPTFAPSTKPKRKSAETGQIVIISLTFGFVCGAGLLGYWTIQVFGSWCSKKLPYSEASVQTQSISMRAVPKLTRMQSAFVNIGDVFANRASEFRASIDGDGGNRMRAGSSNVMMPQHNIHSDSRSSGGSATHDSFHTYPRGFELTNTTNPVFEMHTDADETVEDQSGDCGLRSSQTGAASNSGKVYFEKRATWSRPAGCDEPLPEGWLEIRESSGRVFYDRRTTWTRPVPEDVPLPNGWTELSAVSAGESQIEHDDSNASGEVGTTGVSSSSADESNEDTGSARADGSDGATNGGDEDTGSACAEEVGTTGVSSSSADGSNEGTGSACADGNDGATNGGDEDTGSACAEEVGTTGVSSSSADGSDKADIAEQDQGTSHATDTGSAGADNSAGIPEQDEEDTGNGGNKGAEEVRDGGGVDDTSVSQN